MRLGDVLAARGEHVEDEPAAGLEQLAGGPECSQLLLLVGHVEQGAEGTDDERHALVDRRFPQIADAEIDERADAVLLGQGTRDREHPLRQVDADHGAAGLGDRNRDPARADGELDDGTVAAERLLDVERDVLDDRGAPRVVDPGDRVVEGHAGQSRRAGALVRSAVMDAAALEREGLAAAAAASSTAEIETVRVEYLGRKSAIKQALREVRDRETGMALNAVRERLEAAIDAREAELARAELDARLTTERADITLPVGGYHRGRLHLITQIRREVEDVFLGLGYTIVDGREVEIDPLQLRRTQLPRRAPSTLAPLDHVRR